jgi:hypothetical protein
MRDHLKGEVVSHRFGELVRASWKNAEVARLGSVTNTMPEVRNAAGTIW